MALYRFEATSPMPVEELLNRLRTLASEEVGPWQSLKERFWGRPAIHSPFIGRVEGNTFRFRRDIDYRNSFLPQIRGVVTRGPGGTVLRVSMRLHPFVAVFLTLWLAGVGAGLAFAVSRMKQVSVGVVVPAGMFVFGLGLAYFGFYPEARKARRILEEAIGASSA